MTFGNIFLHLTPFFVCLSGRGLLISGLSGLALLLEKSLISFSCDLPTPNQIYRESMDSQTLDEFFFKGVGMLDAGYFRSSIAHNFGLSNFRFLSRSQRSVSKLILEEFFTQ